MSATTHSITIEFDDNKLIPLLYGEHNAHLTHLENALDIDISGRGNQLIISGNKAKIALAERILNSLWNKISKKQDISTKDIDSDICFLTKNDKKTPKTAKKQAKSMKKTEKLTIQTKKKSIMPRSPNQAAYMQSILDHEMAFGLGPAGTGKTYLAVAVAVSMYLTGAVERLIFTRPAVEAGESLGFLPGDLKDKVDPYLRPIYDAMHDMLPWDFMQKKIEVGEIEVAPLAYMRGRTLSNAFVILDEAQNTTATQMKMFLTRMGESSRMVITGDISQTDLPIGVKSGLRDATEILNGVKGIAFTTFTSEDVTRHKLVGRVIKAYEQHKHKT